MIRRQEKDERRTVVKKKITISSGDRAVEERTDAITVEEPLQIVLQSGKETKNFAVIMRTPVMDFELAAGFLFTEGVIRDRSEIISIEYNDGEKSDSRNVVTVRLSDSSALETPARGFSVNSSCGVCGKSSINEIFLRGSKPVRTRRKLPAPLIVKLPDILRAKQEIFSSTGGIHAAGLFDYSGNIIAVAEDVGRHNAVDKIAGYLLLNDLMGKTDYVLQVSGRAGFEIVQKAAAAGISVVSSVSAPSSLAVETADSFNITLICFVRNNRFNIYTHQERVKNTD